MWSGAPAIQLVSSSNAVLQLLDSQQHCNEKDFACWRTAQLGVCRLLILPFSYRKKLLSQQWRAWDIPTLSNNTCRIVNPLTLIPLLWTSEPGICFTGSLSPAHWESTIYPYYVVNDWLTTSGALHLQTGTWLYILLTRSPNTCCLDLTLDVIRSVTRFRLLVHTLCYETATWNHTSSTTCERCEANDHIQDEQHLYAENLLLYSLRQDLMMCLLS